MKIHLDMSVNETGKVNKYKLVTLNKRCVNSIDFIKELPPIAKKKN